MIGLYKRTDAQCRSRCGSQEKSNNNNNMHIRVVGNNKNNFSRSNEIIPDLSFQPSSDQRYNFYRYYGKNIIIVPIFIHYMIYMTHNNHHLF